MHACMYYMHAYVRKQYACRHVVMNVVMNVVMYVCMSA